MNKTKITAKIYPPLLKSFNDQIANLHLKRDSFLNSILKSEIKYLAEEMQGKKLSSKARRHISKKLKRMGEIKPSTVNIEIDKEVASNLNKIVKESNMVRDAFFNRLILLLRSSEQILERLELPKTLASSEFKSAGSMPISPLKTIESVIADPLYYLRIAADQRFGTGLYTLPFPSALDGFSCYLEDTEAEGTQAFKEKQFENERMEKLLFILESGNSIE